MNMLTRTLVSKLRCAASISFAICFIFPTQSRSQQVAQRTPIQKFEATLAALPSALPDDCGWDQPTRRFNGDTSKLEDELFQDADEAVLNALNSNGEDPARVIEGTLDSLRTTTERVNHDWPADRRFHYDLLTVQPVFVVVYHIRSRSTWSVYARAAS
jgi:hypothetical protein